MDRPILLYLLHLDLQKIGCSMIHAQISKDRGKIHTLIEDSCKMHTLLYKY